MNDTKAHAGVALAVRDGRLVKQRCARCDDPKTEAHHEDYSKPLDVIWLCRKCHRLRHAEVFWQKSGHSDVQITRTTMLLSAELAERVDTYWHNNRLLSRSEAIRELLEAALDAATKPAKIRKAS